MEGTARSAPMRIQEKYGGNIIATAILHNPTTQQKDELMVLGSDISKRVMLMLGMSPIVFDTLSGKQTWVGGFGLLHNTALFVIDDGLSRSLGIYRYDGSRATLGFNSPHGTPETVYRILKSDVSRVDGDPFLLSGNIGSIYNIDVFSRVV